MKITACKTFLVEGIKYNWTLLKIATDAGLRAKTAFEKYGIM